MGREIVAVDSVPAGNVFGILGLEGVIIKMGTVSNLPSCPSLSSLRLAVWFGMMVLKTRVIQLFKLQ